MTKLHRQHPNDVTMTSQKCMYILNEVNYIESFSNCTFKMEHSIKLNLGRDIYIAPTIFKGQVLTHIRTYLKNSEGALIPQKGQGIALKVEEFKALLKVLPTVEDEIIRLVECGADTDINTSTKSNVDTANKSSEEGDSKRKRKSEDSECEEDKKSKRKRL